MKYGAISAQALEHYASNTYYASDADMLNGLCDALNQEYRALADVGCPVIQIEEPLIHFLAADPNVPDDVLVAYVDAFNREIEGVETEIWYHSH